jgi:hypothetical protein
MQTCSSANVVAAEDRMCIDFVIPKKCGLGAPEMVQGSQEYDPPPFY